MIYLAFTLAVLGGSIMGLATAYVWRDDDRRKVVRHYQVKYNEQMNELFTRYRQERVAMIHRHEGQLADIQRELENIAFIVDKDKTKKVVGS